MKGDHMPSLQVREVPEHIYNRIALLAEVEHRSIAQETVSLLAKGLDCELTPRDRRRAVLEKLGNEEKWPQDIPNPVLLIREDRNR
jgi:plasmid stability protein